MDLAADLSRQTIEGRNYNNLLLLLSNKRTQWIGVFVSVFEHLVITS